MRLNIIDFFRETHHTSVLSHMRTRIVECPLSGCNCHEILIWSIEFESNILSWYTTYFWVRLWAGWQKLWVQFVSHLGRRNSNFLQVRRIYATAEIAKSQVLCMSSWHFDMQYEAETSLYYLCEITNQEWRLAWSNWALKSTLISRFFLCFSFA